MGTSISVFRPATTRSELSDSSLVLLGHKIARSSPQMLGVSWGYMTPKPAEAWVVSEIYELLRLAAARRQPVAATYDGQPSCFALMLGTKVRPTACLLLSVWRE